MYKKGDCLKEAVTYNKVLVDIYRVKTIFFMTQRVRLSFEFCVYLRMLIRTCKQPKPTEVVSLKSLTETWVQRSVKTKK